jgi:hypothetical protein
MTAAKTQRIARRHVDTTTTTEATEADEEEEMVVGTATPITTMTRVVRPRHRGS